MPSRSMRALTTQESRPVWSDPDNSVVTNTKEEVINRFRKQADKGISPLNASAGWHDLDVFGLPWVPKSG